jgi:hypothetical protein
VTRDESQVSVGGLLALDQVLRILGHFLPFYDSEKLLKVEHKMKRRSWDLVPFWALFEIWDYVTGMGMLAHGFTHV